MVGACGWFEEKVFEELTQVPAIEGDNADDKFFLVGSSLNGEEKEKDDQFFEWQC